MGLGGSIASTVKNKISGYGGNLVSNAAGAAKSPKRTGSVNHDVEALIEKNDALDNDKVLYYPLDIGTDANGHYLQFFIRKQTNLKMQFTGNESVLNEEVKTTKTITKQDFIMTKIKYVKIDSKENLDKVIVQETKDENGNTKYSQPSGINGRVVGIESGINDKGENIRTFLVVKSTSNRHYTHTTDPGYRYNSKTQRYELAGKKNPWYTVTVKKGQQIFRLYNIKKVSRQVIVSTETGDLGAGETPENEVKVGITNKYPSLRIKSSIALFLPGGIKNETKAEWSETSTRLEYKAQAMLALQGGDVTGSVEGGINAAEMAAKMEVIPNLMDREGAKSGMAYTDRMQVFFKNANKRNFSYTFKFMPKSRKESLRVDDIVKMFRFYGSPSYLNSKSTEQIGSGGTKVNAGSGGTNRGSSGGWSIMRQPQIFEIVYMYKDKRNEYLNRISHCVLESVNITYNGDNNKFFNPSEDKKNGSPAPVETQIDLSFKEIEIITKDKIDQGY